MHTGLGEAVERREWGGFTLFEMIVAIMIYGVVLAAGVGFVAVQNAVFHRTPEAPTGMGAVRAALQVLEAQIPAAGTGVPAGSVEIVYHGADVLAFLGDYTSDRAGDLSAFLVDEDAPADQVRTPTGPVPIAGSGGLAWEPPASARGGPAELIVLRFEDDPTTEAPDDYVLTRSVNGGAPHAVSRHLARVGTRPFFRLPDPDGGLPFVRVTFAVHERRAPFDAAGDPRLVVDRVFAMPNVDPTSIPALVGGGR